MNIFKEGYHALWDFKCYQKFLNNRKGKVFLYGVVFSLVLFLISIVIPLVKFQVKTGGLGNMLESNVPNFEISEGVLDMEAPIHYEAPGMYVDIDTAADQPLYDFYDSAIQEIMDKNESVLIADYEKLYVKNQGQVTQISFNEMFGNKVYNRDSLKSFIPMINGIIAVAVMFIGLFGIAGFFLGALFISVVGLIINSAMKTNLGFGKLFLLSVYVRTMPLLLKALLGLVRISIPFMWLICFIISEVYLYLVLSKIRQAQSEPLEAEEQTV